MAIAQVSGVTAAAQDKTAGITAISIFPAATIPAGSLVVVSWASDNLSATTPTFVVTDTDSHTWTNQIFKAVNATAAAGCAGGAATAILATDMTTGKGATVTLSAAVAAKTIRIEAFSGATQTLRGANATNSGTTAAATVTSASATAGDLVFGLVGSESATVPGADADTTGGAWVTNGTIATSGGATATNISHRSSHKVVSAGGTQTLDSVVTASEWVTGIFIVQAASVAALTKFRIDQGAPRVNYLPAVQRSSRW